MSATLSHQAAAPPLPDLDPIGLDELLAEAELLTRTDRKYLLTAQEAGEALTALDALQPGTRVLEIDGERRFDYESTYFDTPDLLSYRLAAHNRRRRFKVRSRAYLDSDLAFLEVKTRGRRQETIKERMGYAVAHRHHLTAPARNYTAEHLRPLSLRPQVADELVETLRTSYARMTLVPPGGGLRVTVDTDLRWQDPSGRCLALADLVIVETKSGAQASQVDRALWRRGHRPTPISKYATGLAALRGDLPANKWSRVLRHHFDTDFNTDPRSPR